MGTVGRTVGVWDVIGLFDQLTVDFISQRPQILAGLQDSLDDWHRIGHCLHLLERVENLHGLVLQAGVTFLSLHWEEERRRLEVYLLKH